jgi:hypothetical protein
MAIGYDAMFCYVLSEDRKKSQLITYATGKDRVDKALEF